MCNSTSVLVVTAHRRDLAVKKNEQLTVSAAVRKSSWSINSRKIRNRMETIAAPAPSCNMDEELEKGEEALVAMA